MKNNYSFEGFKNKNFSKNTALALVQYINKFIFDRPINNIKNKKRERLKTIEEELRVCLSYIRPKIAAVVKKHQAQLSH